LPAEKHVTDAQAVFEEMRFNGHTTSTANSLPMSILLFLSMLPLHAEDPLRQRAILANALRLYRQFSSVQS